MFMLVVKLVLTDDVIHFCPYCSYCMAILAGSIILFRILNVIIIIILRLCGSSCYF